MSRNIVKNYVRVFCHAVLFPKTRGGEKDAIACRFTRAARKVSEVGLPRTIIAIAWKPAHRSSACRSGLLPSTERQYQINWWDGRQLPRTTFLPQDLICLQFHVKTILSLPKPTPSFCWRPFNHASIPTGVSTNPPLFPIKDSSEKQNKNKQKQKRHHTVERKNFFGKRRNWGQWAK